MTQTTKPVDRRLLDLLEQHTDVAIKYAKSNNPEYVQIHLRYIEEYVAKIRQSMGLVEPEN